MANFSFDDLRLVNPQTDYQCDDARRMAVKATPILEQAGVFSSLAEALADCHFSMATTRRLGAYRQEFLRPDQAAEVLLPLSEQGRIGLVFGREDHGLFNNELDLCQRLITIPTADKLPSMNLAQAVSLCLYEIHKAKKAFGHRALSKKLAQLAKDPEKAKVLASTLVSRYDHAVTKGVIPHGRANRRKSRIALFLAKIKKK